ncbi:Amidohydrolase [Pigmentiphaga humi]|uniref:Amidohydrolase n=1 Tax=Pigmentiphaga humi TaxID=2478468 RepID=A0A3P4B2A1_9BURK|nr:amidohydrolase family protein [Pigmentiphaga humi]VCU70417.1 Amidohydrolase [Pigmentiphaga humi]
MFIADSQVHLWKDETPDRPWLPGARERMKLNGHRLEAFTHEECIGLMDEAGVDRVLIVPPSWEGDRIDYALEACAAHPGRFGIMARIPQNKPEEAKAMLRDWKSLPDIKGVRLTFHRPQDRNWMIDGTCDWFWPFAEENGVIAMVHAPVWKAELGAIAKRHPGLKIIIDHMGIMARCVDDAIGYWVQETADLHEHPNIYVKVSALPGYSTHPFPNQNIFKYVREMVDKMGPERCFWGTDLTRLLDHGLTYTDTVEQFTKHMDFSQRELEQIMGLGLCKCLNWPVPADAR